jgi:hypothetical protein
MTQECTRPDTAHKSNCDTNVAHNRASFTTFQPLFLKAFPAKNGMHAEPNNTVAIKPANQTNQLMQLSLGKQTDNLHQTSKQTKPTDITSATVHAAP